MYSTDGGDGPRRRSPSTRGRSRSRAPSPRLGGQPRHGDVRSVVELGNRVRVRVGPLTAEITAGSAERLELREGEPVVASFKATASRLVPLG